MKVHAKKINVADNVDFQTIARMAAMQSHSVTMQKITIIPRTSGASNDIKQATKLARAMITRYGMSNEFNM